LAKYLSKHGAAIMRLGTWAEQAYERRLLRELAHERPHSICIGRADWTRETVEPFWPS
jgi:hypothetical protein